MPTRGTCAYCGVDDLELTVEHVFPESWYPDEHRPSDMLTVPACSPCNHRYGRIEERMFLELVSSLPKDPRTTSLVERALRTTDPAAARNPRDAKYRRRRGERFLRRTRILRPDQPSHRENLWTRSGPKVGTVAKTADGIPILGKVEVHYAWPDLQAIAVKLLRGYYYDVSKTPLPRAPRPWGRTYRGEFQYALSWFASSSQAITRGSFPFSFVLRCDFVRGLAAGFFGLWDEIMLFATNIPPVD